MILSACSGRYTLLILLDLSAAFDTVDHERLLNDLSSFGVREGALSVLSSYLRDRYFRVSVGHAVSEQFPLHCGVPQGSVLGPILFIVYTRQLAHVLEAHGVRYHFYADDSQIYLEVDSDNIVDVSERVLALMSDIKVWMLQRRLKLNENKTEITIIKGNMRHSISEDFGALVLGDSMVRPLEVVKNLGVILDSSLKLDKHVSMIVKSCNFQLRNLYAVKRFLNKESLITLVHSLVISKVDYCNSLFIGLSHHVLRKLQSILNRAARLIYSLAPGTPTTGYLIDLHWLPVKARIEFKICLLTFKAVKFGKPKYIADMLLFSQAHGDRSLRSADDPFLLLEPRAVNERGLASHSFSYVAPRLFNKLPVWLKSVNSEDAFKKHLKTFIFSKAYDVTYRTVSDFYVI